MDLNATTIIASAIGSSINGMAMYLSVRYVGKIADRIEHSKIIKKTDKEKEETKE